MSSASSTERTDRVRATRRPARERRRQIVDAAIEEFARKSFREVGTADIAARVGVSEPTLYRHFTSKRELYLAAIDHSTTLIVGAWRSLAERGPTPLDALRAIGLWSFEQLRDDPPHLAVRARALVETSEPEAVGRLREHFEEMRSLVEGLYRSARDQGLVPRSIDARARTWAFMSLGALLDRTQMLGLAAELDAEAMARVTAGILPELLERGETDPVD